MLYNSNYENIILAPRTISRPETLHGFNLLQANLDVQGMKKLFNIVYNMIQQKKSQEVAQMLFVLKKAFTK